MNVKLTTAAMQTYGGHQWRLGEWLETSGEGGLCGPGWIHYYEGTPELAVALDPIHGNFGEGRRLFRVEVDGEIKRDLGLKAGTTKLRLVEELPAPVVSTTALVRWAIYCARAIPRRMPITEWELWADGWLAGQRSEMAAAPAAAAANAVRAAAWTEWAVDAARAAAWAADAARSAAWAAWTEWAVDAARSAAWAAWAVARAAAWAVDAARAADEGQIPLSDLLARAIEEED